MRLKMERRNPYLMEYEEQLRLHRYMQSENARRQTGRDFQRRAAQPVQQRYVSAIAASPSVYRESELPDRRTKARRSRAACARARRRRAVRRQRLAVCAWALCLLILSVTFLIRNTRAAAATPVDIPQTETDGEGNQSIPDTELIQGLPASVYATHPYWTENFLTPNEYSRPGDTLGQVNDIFVHYTANQGTSAAQNRSYFEQQKDMHERSVSAHFIIGYEGEIIQCVPLDEIAYAVQTRNEDSVSIECCYLAEDGSFTQETYDSLIRLLAWLVNTYDLDTDNILRHYDCGGKKCPIYYTENEDAWEQLKEDVDRIMQGNGV